MGVYSICGHNSLIQTSQCMLSLQKMGMEECVLHRDLLLPCGFLPVKHIVHEEPASTTVDQSCSCSRVREGQTKSKEDSCWQEVLLDPQSSKCQETRPEKTVSLGGWRGSQFSEWRREDQFSSRRWNLWWRANPSLSTYLFWRDLYGCHIYICLCPVKVLPQYLPAAVKPGIRLRKPYKDKALGSLSYAPKAQTGMTSASKTSRLGWTGWTARCNQQTVDNKPKLDLLSLMAMMQTQIVMLLNMMNAAM